MKAQYKLAPLGIILSALFASKAMALEVYNKDNWKLDISGSVNAFYTTTKADNASRSSQIENGLLPGYFTIGASTQYNGLDVKGVIGIWPGIDSDSPLIQSATGGVGRSTVDARTNYLSFGNAKIGTFKLGRDIGLFQSNAILNDMTLIGVGGGAGVARNINTTLGGIGAGYIYAEFQPQITYTTPNLSGFSASIGVFDNKDVDATGTAGRTPGYQGLAQYEFKGGDLAGKAWVGFVNQHFNRIQTNNATGFELGAKADIGSLGLLAQGFSGKGIGDTILFAGGTDAAFNNRNSRGYLTQATYKFGDLKLGVSYGESKTDKTSQEGGGTFNKVDGVTGGAYYSLTPNLTLVGELNRRKNKVTEIATDSVSLGAILFF
jgi:predicted porin